MYTFIISLIIIFETVIFVIMNVIIFLKTFEEMKKNTDDY